LIFSMYSRYRRFQVAESTEMSFCFRIVVDLVDRLLIAEGAQPDRADLVDGDEDFIPFSMILRT